MNEIPILGFSAYSGTGKTTLIEKLVASLKARGMRIAVIKHDGRHQVELDRKGKDSWRFTQAGADISIVSSAQKTAYIEERPMELSKLISMVHDVDLILVEGYKREPLPQIGICREATGKGFPSEIDRYVAVITDKKEIAADIPVFSFEEIDAITDFIVENRSRFRL